MLQPPGPPGGAPADAAGTPESALAAAASATTKPAFDARALLILLTSVVDGADVTSATVSSKGGNPLTLGGPTLLNWAGSPVAGELGARAEAELCVHARERAFDG